jgi:hypothetical protein
MDRGDALQEVGRRLSKQDFERTYEHLWLIRELDPDERAPGSFETGVWDARTAMNSVKRTRPATLSRLVPRVKGDPGHFGFYALAKSGANPWSDRVLIGRASNNDIVFRHDSVSKLHAYFQRGRDGGWELFDAKSANGTFVRGQRIEAGGPGTGVQSGAVLLFGNLACELIGSGELWGALR